MRVPDVLTGTRGGRRLRYGFCTTVDVTFTPLRS
jgi:hypothetical protein